MKNKIAVLSSIITLVAPGCFDPIVNTNYDIRDSYESSISNTEEGHADISLTTGKMTLSGNVKEIDSEVKVSWVEGVKHLQVIADVELYSYEDPTFLRVIFSSDRIEWVGMDGFGYDVYDSEEDCIEAENHCDEVIPGHGVGGVFESSPGIYSAVVNTHCSTFLHDYDYNVYAYVIDFSGAEPVYVSDTAMINIKCIQQ